MRYFVFAGTPIHPSGGWDMLAGPIYREARDFPDLKAARKYARTLSRKHQGGRQLGYFDFAVVPAHHNQPEPPAGITLGKWNPDGFYGAIAASAAF